ncbi:MAG TPA: hypothetical protein VJT31_21070 [Rugosimonospora sp.]|nr:hypothetical protein [Rugosimonospora sp.]
MTIEHQVRRPEWRCGTDGEEWPCDGARRLLGAAHRETPDALTRYLAHLMAQAASDLGVRSPTTLYRRFVGWSLGRSQVCRVCGRSGHDVVAGVPPRLFPCEDRLPARAPAQHASGVD